jgi:hypothetical protein
VPSWLVIRGNPAVLLLGRIIGNLSLTPGTRLGVYGITAQIGMGEKHLNPLLRVTFTGHVTMAGI